MYILPAFPVLTTMRRVWLLLLVTQFCMPVFSQSARLEWVRTLGVPGQNTPVVTIVIDSNKWVYTGGHFKNTLDVNAGPGTEYLTAPGSNNNIYIAKYDTAGIFSWGKGIGGTSEDRMQDMKTDGMGNLLVLGRFAGTVDFDPGPGVHNITTTFSSAFLLKLDPNGGFIWVKHWLINQMDKLEVDGHGNIILAGGFAATQDFDPGPGTYPLTATTVNNFDPFVLKLDANAAFVWARQVSNPSGSQTQYNGLECDSENSIYFAGNFTETLDFDPGAGIANRSAAGLRDGFILKLDENGNYKWVAQFGSTGTDDVDDLEIDRNDFIYTTGVFAGLVDFDPGPGQYNLSSAVPTVRTCFISKLNRNGDFVWARALQGGESFGQAITVDSVGNVYIAGGFKDYSGPVDFDPGAGVYQVHKGNWFTMRLNPNADFQWAAGYITQGLPGTYESIYCDVKVDSMQNVYYGSSFVHPADFDPGPALQVITPIGPWDAVFLKLKQCDNCTDQLNFFPKSGPVGTVVTLRGKPFSTTTTNNIVHFGSVKGTVLTASADSITVSVPLGTSFAPISVTVDNTNTYYTTTGFIITFQACSNLSASSFAPAQEFNIPAGGTIMMAVKDIDGDSKPDLAASTHLGLSLARNTSTPGNPGFSFQPLVQPNPTNSYTRGIAFGDFDGDGKEDIACTAADYEVKVYKNTSTAGTISVVKVLDLVAGSGSYATLVNDFDYDGKPDIMVTNEDNFTFWVYRNTTAGGTISFAAPVSFVTGAFCRDPAVADIDGDGKIDVLVPNQGSKTISVFRNTSVPGTVSFATRIDIATPLNSRPQSIAAGDLDGDGKPDIVFQAYLTAAPGYVCVLRNTSVPGTISFAPRQDLVTDEDPFKVILTDLNGDGKLDISVNCFFKLKVQVFQNTSTPGNTTFNSIIDLPVNGALLPLAVCDMDMDGKPDIMTGMSRSINGNTSYMLGFFRNILTLAPELSINATIDASCNNNNGSITVSGTSGTPPYQYSLDNANFQAGTGFANLAAGNYTVTIKDNNGCTAASNVTLVQSGSPTINLNVTHATCNQQNGTITVVANGGTVPYTYSKDGTIYQPGTSFSNMAPGAYTVYVKDAKGCTVSAQVTVNAVCLQITATPVNSTCGNSNGSISATASGGTLPYQFSVDGINYQASGNFDNLAASTYTVYVTDATNTTTTTTATVQNITGPTVTVVTSATGCGNNEGMITATAAGGTLPYAYAINTQAFQSSNTFIALPRDVYTVRVKDANGCVATATDSITLVSDLNLLAGNAVAMCSGDSAVINAVTNADVVTWEPSTQISDIHSLNPVVFPDRSRRYIITASKGICTLKDSVDVTVYKQPVVNAGTDAWVMAGNTHLLAATANDSNYLFSWTPSLHLNNAAILTPLLTATVTQAYTLTATNGFCTASDTVLVTVFESLQVPNVFSPNGDGINDKWVIRNLQGYPKAVTEIFDRYGRLVYRANGASYWDGSHGGKPAPVGTYYYVLNPGFMYLKPLTGYVVLLR